MRIALATALVSSFLSACATSAGSGESDAAQSGDAESGDLALVGATIQTSPLEEPLRDGVVLIRGGTIVAVGARNEVVVPHSVPTLDCRGGTITAGFWNSHAHLFERKWADAATIPAPELGRQLSDTFTRYGFTSVFDLSSQWSNTRCIRERIESGEVAGPRIRSTGEGLVPPGAMPSEQVLATMGIVKTAHPEFTDAPAAAAAAGNLLDGGVDGIKVFSSRAGPLPDGAIEAVVSEAHRLEKPVFLHPNTGLDVLAAIRGGVDVVAHTTPRSGPWDESILAQIGERRVALTPTLTLARFFARHERVSTQEQLTRTAVGQLRAWISAGGVVLFGTDVGAVDPDPGEEYEQMAEAGMSFRDILASLTTTPAQRFTGSEGAGRIAVGLPADLVVLNGDPSANLSALTEVRATLREGRIVYRASESPW